MMIMKGKRIAGSDQQNNERSSVLEVNASLERGGCWLLSAEGLVLCAHNSLSGLEKSNSLSLNSKLELNPQDFSYLSTGC